MQLLEKYTWSNMEGSVDPHNSSCNEIMIDFINMSLKYKFY